MNYQVFAIRTRPQSFAEVVGQDPIVSALTHALDKNKLHHAYLFTGTRGVGKTTLARIIAKSVNCEQGITSTPCNACANCQSIAQGKFPDLIEIDAASKTKVEDTRSLLDTVIYAPTQGRYKIYLIDEVHMLSTHSFNALLKTLEEPPAHVKFLLATTDPQKIPATILSRCLQFSLKWVDAAVIASHLEKILINESIKFELPAVQLIAQAAQGSIRDSLSLLEQAVALGAGEVSIAQVRLMLGRIAGADIIELLNCVISQDNNAVITKLNNLAMVGTDFSQVLTQLIYALHQIAVLQQAPEVAYELDVELHYDLPTVAKQITPQDLQVYYQIALLAKRDLPYSPQPRLALEMALIRMLNFMPVNLPAADSGSRASHLAGMTQASAPSSHGAAPSSHGAAPSSHGAAPSSRGLTAGSGRNSASVMDPAVKPRDDSNAVPRNDGNKNSSVNHNFIEPNKENWAKWLGNLGLAGMHLQLLKNAEFASFAENQLVLNLEPRFNALVNDKRVQEIEQKIEIVSNRKIKIILNRNQEVIVTPANIEQTQRQQKHEDLVVNLQNDPHIKQIINTFNGELRLDSVELTDN